MDRLADRAVQDYLSWYSYLNALGLHTFRTAKAKPSIELDRLVWRGFSTGLATVNSQSRVVSLQLGLVAHGGQLGVITLEMIVLHCDRQSIELKSKEVVEYRECRWEYGVLGLYLEIGQLHAEVNVAARRDTPEYCPSHSYPLSFAEGADIS